MTTLRYLGVVALVFGLAVAGLAQPPAAAVLPAPAPPPPPAPPSPYPVGINSYPPPPGGPTVWTKLGIDAQQREYRQLRQARTPFGDFREKIQNPLSKLTGGLIKPFPPLAATEALLKDPGPIGAAAKIKLDKAGAPDRVKAVKELAAVDCYYWPEAEDALVGALRVDRDERVRLAAAQALGAGGCCTKKTITALSIAASCSDADGNPAEKSLAVVAAAHDSLRSCMERVCACAATEPLIDPVNPRTDPVIPRTDPTTTPPVSSSKPGPAGYEKPIARELSRPTTSKEYYERASQRRWVELIPSAQAVLARTPHVPALLLLSGAGNALEPEVADGRTRAHTRPNLYDWWFGDEASEVRTVAYASTPLPSSEPRTSGVFDRFFASTPPQQIYFPPEPAASAPAPQPTTPRLLPTVKPTPAPAPQAMPAAPRLQPAKAEMPAPTPEPPSRSWFDRLFGSDPPQQIYFPPEPEAPAEKPAPKLLPAK